MKINKEQKLALGMHVGFTNGRGDQSGIIRHILPCISNGRTHAVIEVNHRLAGIFESVPVDEITSQFVFIPAIDESEEHAIPTDQQRRYLPVTPTTRSAA